MKVHLIPLVIKVQDLVAVINSIARATKSIPLINLTIGGLAVGANLIFAYNVLMDSAIKDAQDNLKQKLQNKEFQSLDENFLNYNPETDLGVRTNSNIHNTAIKGEILEKRLGFIADWVKKNDNIVIGETSIYGNDDRDNLRGQKGNDTLIGGADADTLYGGDGDDILIGGINEKHVKDDNA